MKRIKGTKDIYGSKQDVKKHVLSVLEEISTIFNYARIDTPTFEAKNVFVRSVGESSDVVKKEMYEFTDKGNRELVLRPEGTAGVVRAIVENKLYAQALPLKLYYAGSMFRYENPQLGRQREFSQYGVEVIGEKSPYLDAEVILTAYTILDSLKIPYKLEINSLGDKDTRDKWSVALKKYFKKYEKDLTDDSKKRIDKNPIRILDDKVDGKKEFVKKAPKINEFYSPEIRTYLDQLLNFLKIMGIPFTLNHNLVRGFDYYTDTVFEFIATSKTAGAQATIIGGGRYENLIAQFGGPQLSGIGFALGLERLINELEVIITVEDIAFKPDVYVLNIDQDSTPSALGIVYMLRRSGIATAWNYKPAKLFKAFDKADKSGVKIKVIVGTKDIEKQQVTVKINKNQESIKIADLVAYLTNKLGDE